MSVLMSKDKKELIVTCDCKCGQSFSICVDDESKDLDYYAFKIDQLHNPLTYPLSTFNFHVKSS